VAASLSSRALLVTYHAVEAGPPPLCIDPELFARHLDAIVESRATVLTVGALAAALRDRRLPERAVAITFDDGCASVAETAGGLLAERGLVATVFCVARHLGGRSDWPSQPDSAPLLRLADAVQLKQLAESGWEIGSHGLDHNVLVDGSEFAESRRALEAATGVPVRSFAFPYGLVASGASTELVRAGYEAACTTRIAPATVASDPMALPRVDAHYLRRPALLRAAFAGRLDLYLRVRAGGARARRLVRKDYVTT
jgi:peptidoglycan/xylan/chitin deacetylase (PgdA/CDA1 family)